ncbi:MAG: helix-turn-helix domain-containing protein [Oscillospiraceae bacterium]|nr:helix-turn-helix domain-containing protein [Oscillospiraceae bacterium]
MNNTKFHEKLQKLRKEKGMSQEELAGLLEVSRQAVSKWESGQSYPETEKLIALSEMFGVTLESLIKDAPLEKDEANVVSEPFWLHKGNYFEYKSERKFKGLPLVHVNIGLGRTAKGVFALGLIAKGYISIGLLAMGLVSFGLGSVGLLSFGVFALGLLLAVGAMAAGIVAIGAIAIGVFTIGAVSIGMFSLGAAAVASHVAIGDYARSGNIAIGVNASGKNVIEVADTSRIFIDVTRAQVGELLDAEFPGLWGWVREVVLMGFGG